MMRCGTGRINSAFEQVPKESANFSRQKFSKGWMKFECYLGRLPFKPYWMMGDHRDGHSKGDTARWTEEAI